MQGKTGLILKYAAFSNLDIKRRKILERAHTGGHLEVVAEAYYPQLPV